MEKLNAVMLIKALASEQDGLCLVRQLVQWLSYPRFSFERRKRNQKLLEALPLHKAECAKIADTILNWLTQVHLYPALVSLGVFSRRGSLS